MPVNFYLDSKTDKKGEHQIKISISMQGIRLLTSIGYNINQSYWLKNKQEVRKNTKNKKGFTDTEINNKILKLKHHFLEIERERKQVTRDDLKNEINKIRDDSDNFIPRDEDVEIIPLFVQFIKERSVEYSWAKSTLKQYNVLRAELLKFKPHMRISDLNENLIVDFTQFSIQLGLYNSTIAKRIRQLKCFISWIKQKGFPVEENMKETNVKLKQIQNKIVFLNWDELQRMYYFQFPEDKKMLERIRDIFCFSAFTSLRYSDVRNLKKADIYDDMIHVTTIKTDTTISIELNKYSRALVEKYLAKNTQSDCLFKVCGNGKMNQLIKEVAYLCEINEPIQVSYYNGSQRYDQIFPKYELISTHTARRTFISNAIMIGIPPHVVMKWTGHSNYKTLQSYIDINDEAKKSSMNLFNTI